MNDEYRNQYDDNPDSDRSSRIIIAIQNGDKKVFKELFETYYNPMLRFAFRYVNCRVTAEGIVQNIFLWIWENRKTWTVERTLKTYLFRSVKYKSIDHLRHERVKEDYITRLNTDKDSTIHMDIPFEFGNKEDEFVCLAQQAIEELPQRPRMIYKMSRLEGLTYNEIADVLQISPKTVETHMSRALNLLRKRLAKYLPALLFWGILV